MTREEAKRRIEICRDFLANNYSDMGEPNFTAFNMAIKALSQEPCDNAISRSDMLDAIGHGTTYTSEELQRVIQNLPPVNPQPLEGFIDGIHAMGYREGYKDAQKQKSGEWFIDERPESDREVICSNCDQPIFKYHKLDFDYRPKYCPNCGAKMESEDKE